MPHAEEHKWGRKRELKWETGIEMMNPAYAQVFSSFKKLSTVSETVVFHATYVSNSN